MSATKGATAAEAMPGARRLIYLHGFRSSSRSFKARLLAARMAQLGHSERFFAPDLPASPAAAVATVWRDFAPDARDLFVGSSLGGFYATWLAQRSGARAVLLNPVIFAARDLAVYVGEQVGYHDGRPFRFESHYLQELAQLEAVALTHWQRYLLIAAKGDELIDWKEMRAHYSEARQVILEGGDHGLSMFGDLVDAVLTFGGLGPPAGDRNSLPQRPL